MSETSPTPDVDLRAWVRKHQVCWELAPMRELVKGHGVHQTGYCLRLFGRIERPARADNQAVARGIYDRLRMLVAEAMRSVPVDSQIQVQPFGRVVLRLEPRLIVEQEFALVASPADPDHPLPPDEVRRLIAVVEEKLHSMGLKKRT
jgi:hypothetical protein